MDSATAGLDFAAIGHQDNWDRITAFVNHVRGSVYGPLTVEKIKGIFPYFPPRDVFHVRVRSSTGKEVRGVYIDTFIDPDKLGTRFTKANITKVMQASTHAIGLGPRIVTLGGFTSIVLEGNFSPLMTGVTKFTTGNTLTAAYIVKGIEKAARLRGIDLSRSALLVIGATGDIGMACVNYFKTKCKSLLLCARNRQRLNDLAGELKVEKIDVRLSTDPGDLLPDADVILCVASDTGIPLTACKNDVLICDAGYPRNIDSRSQVTRSAVTFFGGMGQVKAGYSINPDYSSVLYKHPAPHVIHGCILEAIVLAFEGKFEPYSVGKGNISQVSIEDIYRRSVKHGIDVAPFFNDGGLWEKSDYTH
jgi:predicted amino acid dehydrogenase